MNNRNETALEILAGNSPCTRREFVHRFAVTACAAAVPAFLAACGSDKSGTKPGATDYTVSFRLRFSKPMDRASVENAIYIYPEDADTENAEITWSDNDRVLYYKTGVARRRDYTVNIGETAADKKGLLLDSDCDNTGGENGDAYTFNVPAV